jgi:hypothetical protein
LFVRRVTDALGCPYLYNEATKKIIVVRSPIGSSTCSEGLNMTIRSLFSAVALVVVGSVALPAAARTDGAGASQADVQSGGDGFISPQEACTGGPDVYSQTEIIRPWGGVLLAHAWLTSDKRVALAEAARARFEASGAVWRVVTFSGALPVGSDAILVGSCGPDVPGFSWGEGMPSGTIGVNWAALPSSQWVAGLSQTLSLLEGDGPL